MTAQGHRTSVGLHRPLAAPAPRGGRELDDRGGGAGRLGSSGAWWSRACGGLLDARGYGRKGGQAVAASAGSFMTGPALRGKRSTGRREFNPPRRAPGVLPLPARTARVACTGEEARPLGKMSTHVLPADQGCQHEAVAGRTGVSFGLEVVFAPTIGQRPIRLSP